jgi:putative ABC transport system substrate-binding protein
MKHLYTFRAFLTGLSFLLVFNVALSSEKSIKKVAIIVPAEIQALEEITHSFQETLHKEYSGDVVFKIANTQGDINLQYSTLRAMRDQNYDLIVPIGSGATSMALSVIKKTPILSLASDISSEQRQKLHPCNIAIVHDEISSEQQLSFIHQAFPTLKKIVLLHSAEDKIFPEVSEVKKTGEKLGITIVPLMAATLPDLLLVANNIPDDAQAIFILKDMQMVSGISQIAKIAQQKHIVLISSDDGSVKNGAGFALGVHENQIGINGAVLAADILKGNKACSLPITEMRDLTVFLNPIALKKFGTSSSSIEQAAKQMNYHIEIVQ